MVAWLHRHRQRELTNIIYQIILKTINATNTHLLAKERQTEHLYEDLAIA